MSSLVRAASLTHFAELAARHSLDASSLLREVGLPARALHDPDLKVPAVAVGRLLELAAERGREPAFGLKLAESRRLSNLGPLGLLVRDEPTLRDALEAVVRYIHLHNEALTVRLEEVGSLVSIREELISGTGEPFRQATELSVAVTFRVLRLLLGARWRPRLVCFSHAAPQSDVVHRRLFGNAVEFGHVFNGIVCDARDLDVPNPGADPVMARYTRALLEPAPDATGPLSERIRRLIVLLLPRGYCRIEVVAQQLGIDRRTVARALAAERTTFKRLVDELRCELLRRYRTDGSRPLKEVSTLLGFSAASAFTRWHRQHFGVTARSHARRAAR